MLIAILILFFCFAFVDSSTHKCLDKDHRCGTWSRQGECKDAAVKKSCPKSCKVCVQKEDDILNDLIVSADQSFTILTVFLSFFIAGIIVAWIKIFSSGGCCRSKGTMKGKVVVITGGTSGIGLETAFHLGLRGARIIIGCKSLKKGLQVVKNLRSETGKKYIEVRKLDLSSFDSVKEFAQEIDEGIDKIDVLINNAGIISGPRRKITSDSLEETFQVNYLSHFLLTKLLIRKLNAGDSSGRIINVVSDGYQKGELKFSDLQGEKEFNNIQAYNDSKLSQVLFTHELSKTLKETNVTVNVVNPGNCTGTNLWNNIFPYNYRFAWFLMAPYTYLFWKSPSMGAETTYYCSLERNLENVTGKYFKDCEEAALDIPIDDEIARKLFEFSERLIEPSKVSTVNGSSVKNDIVVNEEDNNVIATEDNASANTEAKTGDSSSNHDHKD